MAASVLVYESADAAVTAYVPLSIACLGSVFARHDTSNNFTSESLDNLFTCGIKLWIAMIEIDNRQARYWNTLLAVHLSRLVHQSTAANLRIRVVSLDIRLALIRCRAPQSDQWYPV